MIAPFIGDNSSFGVSDPLFRLPDNCCALTSIFMGDASPIWKRKCHLHQPAQPLLPEIGISSIAAPSHTSTLSSTSLSSTSSSLSTPIIASPSPPSTNSPIGFISGFDLSGYFLLVKELQKGLGCCHITQHRCIKLGSWHLCCLLWHVVGAPLLFGRWSSKARWG